MRRVIAVCPSLGVHWPLQSPRQIRARATTHVVRSVTTGCGDLRNAVDDDELVGMLVQDAFRSAPPRPAITEPGKITRPQSGDHARTLTAHLGSPAGPAPRQPRVESEPCKAPPPPPPSGASATAGNTAPDTAATAAAGAVTNSRAGNAVAEPFACVRRRPVDAGVEPSEPVLEWRCSTCQTYNAVGAAGAAPCSSCGAPAAASYRCAAPPVRHVALMPPAWVCQQCSHLNEAVKSAPGVAATTNAPATPVAASAHRRKFQCQGCQAPFGGVQHWICPSCAHLCPRAATQCPTCFAERPLSWTCPQCGSSQRNSIFASRCRDCEHDRVEKRSNSIVRCPACAEWNDVRWELCAGCMAPLSALVATVPTADRGTTTSHATARGTEASASASSSAATTLTGLPDGRRVEAPSTDVVHSATVEKVSTLLRALEARDDAAPATGPRTPSPQPRDGDDGRGEGERPRVAVRLPDNAWWCANCNVAHRRNVGFCDICLASAEEMRVRNLSALTALRDTAGVCVDGASTEMLTVVPVIRDGDWQCPHCRRLLGVTQQSCCGHQREAPPGYWLCERCCSTNHGERPQCLGCGEARGLVCAWTCPECEWHNEAARDVCGQCGLPNAQRVASVGAADAVADGSSSVTCPVCSAPNHAEKMACFRCRARLREVEWTCGACGHGNRKRSSVRCESCNAIHEFDGTAEVWLCQLCSTAVLSGGEVPVRNECPQCNMTRSANATHYPARWRCVCGVHNRARQPECVECGAQRRIEGLHTSATCPQCFRDTPLDVAETCAHCSASLSSCFAVWEGDFTQRLSAPRFAVSSAEADADVAAEDFAVGAELVLTDDAAVV